MCQTARLNTCTTKYIPWRERQVGYSFKHLPSTRSHPKAKKDNCIYVHVCLAQPMIPMGCPLFVATISLLLWFSESFPCPPKIFHPIPMVTFQPAASCSASGRRKDLKRVISGKEFGFAWRIHMSTLSSVPSGLLMVSSASLWTDIEDLDIDFELVDVSWKLVAAAVNGPLSSCRLGPGDIILQAYGVLVYPPQRIPFVLCLYSDSSHGICVCVCVCEAWPRGKTSHSSFSRLGSQRTIKSRLSVGSQLGGKVTDSIE